MSLFQKSLVKSIEIDQEIIDAGETVSGRVNLDVGSGSVPITALCVQLVGYSRTKCDAEDEDCWDTHAQMYASDKFTRSQYRLPKGQHKLEFSLTAPQYCPSSLKGNLTDVIYNVYVKLESKGKTEKHKKCVTVAGGSANHDILFHPVKLSNNGLELRAFLPSTNPSLYNPGEDVRYIITATWKNFPLTKIRTKLTQELVYSYPKCHKRLPEVKYHKLTQREFNLSPNALPKSKHLFLQESIRIPSDAMNSFIADGFHPVQVMHYLCIEAEMDGVSQGSRGRLPLTIGSPCVRLQPSAPPSEELPPSYESCMRSEQIKL